MANNKTNGDMGGEQEVVVEVSYVAAVFDDVKAAKNSYDVLKALNREGLLQIGAAAYMEKTDRSKVKVHEFKDWSGKKGAWLGGGAGAVIGIVGSAVLFPVAIGALVGGTLAHVHDTKFSDKDLRQAADALPPGSSALVALVADAYVADVEKELTKEGGKKVHSGEVPKSAVVSVDDAKAS